METSKNFVSGFADFILNLKRTSEELDQRKANEMLQIWGV